MASCAPRIWTVCLTAFLAAAAACSSASDPSDGGDGSGGDDGAGDDGAGNGADDGDGSSGGQTFRVEWGPVMAEPSVENTLCVRKRLATDRPIRVGQIVNALGNASHHMIVYRLSGEGLTETVEPEECTPFVDVLDPSAGAPLAVTQRAEETISLPPGVAFTLEPEQMIRVELHFINATDTPQELRASTTFVELPEEEVEEEADFLFVGNPDINIGPRSSFSLDTPFLPLPDELAGIRIFAVTGHEHQWGTGVTASMTTGGEDEGTPIYEPENFQWSEPETIYHDPPLVMPVGGGFRFTCTWQNMSDARVGFGESVGDEMCFFWAYYYPSKGARICAHTDELGGLDVCCPGDDALCSLIDAFLNN